jgi:hypothetical protein
MASISPICKKCKIFISALKSTTYIDFMIKKSLKSKTSKSHTWAPLKTTQNWCMVGEPPKVPHKKSYVCPLLCLEYLTMTYSTARGDVMPKDLSEKEAVVEAHGNLLKITLISEPNRQCRRQYTVVYQ